MDYTFDSTADPGNPADPPTSDTDVQMNSETSEEKFLDLLTGDEEETKEELTHSQQEENADVESQVEKEPVDTLSKIPQGHSTSSVRFAEQEEKQTEQDPIVQQEDIVQDESLNTSEIISPDELSNYHTCRSEEEVLPLLPQDEFQKKLFREWKGQAKEKETTVFKVLYEKYKARYENDDILPHDTYSFFVFAQFWFYRTDIETQAGPLVGPLALPKVTERRTLVNFGESMKFWESAGCCYPSFGNATFWIALAVFLCQMCLLILLFFSGDRLRYFGEDGILNNPGPPSNLGWSIRVSQFLALAVSVSQQEEVLVSINSIFLFFKYKCRASETYQQSNITNTSKSEEHAQLVSRNCIGHEYDNLLQIFFDDYVSKKQNNHRYCMKWGWWVAIAFRLAVGFFALHVTLMLILTEESVKDILLNFTAVQFISTVDNGVFQLASWGYLGKDITTIAGLIEDAKYEDKEEGEDDDVPEQEKEICCCFNWSKKVIPLIILFFAFFTVWVPVAVKEEQGDYFCQTLFVQFGDENSPELASFTGYYDYKFGGMLRYWKNRKPVDDRPEYWARKIGKGNRTAKFGYDGKTNAWSFAHSNNMEELPLGSDKTNWTVHSVDKSKAFNLLDVAGEEWVSNIDTNNKKSSSLPMQYLRMECVCADEKCDKKKNCKQDDHCFNGGECNKYGMCECANGWWGPQCKLRYPCDTLEIDPQFGKFSGDQIWSKRYFNVFDEPLAYKSIEKTSVNSTVYGRPVFVGNRNDKGNVDLIFFTGRRWVLTSTELLEDFNTSKPYNNTDPNAELRSNIKDIKGLKMSNTTETIFKYAANYLVNDFHAHFSNYKAYFVSQSMDITSINNAASPENLQWYHAKRVIYQGKTVVQPDFNRPSKAVLLCATCNKDTNPCFYNNTCNDDGKCDCTSTGSSGELCQIAPSDNGKCNMYFNKHEFAYDGGDCCEASCVRPNCPKKGGMHYPNCTDPDWECEDPAVTCFKENINEIFGECANGESGRAVALSDNSKESLYLAIGEPGCDGVRVYDTTTREQRGQWIKGPVDSSFGDSVALSDDANVLAIGAPGDHRGNGTVWIYNWIENHKEWVVGFQETGEEGDSRLGESLELSDAGDKLVVATNMRINIWTKGGTNNWTQTEQEFALEGAVQKGKALSISSDAKFIAVATTINGENSTQIYKEENRTYSKYGNPLDDRMSVVISGDARVLVAADSKQTFAYYRNNGSEVWDTIDVNDTKGIIKTSPVALSKEGDTLVVDTELDGEKNFLVYLLQVPNKRRALEQVNSSTSFKFEAINANGAIPSGQGRYAALSYIETGEIVIAVGDPLANNTGKTSMYSAQAGSSVTQADLEQRQQLCKEQGTEPVSLEVTITTDDHPEKISWKVVDIENTPVWTGGSYTNKNNQEKEETKRLCRESLRRLRLFEDDRKMLAESNCHESCWTFTINHAPSNESNSVGMYEVKWNENVAVNGTFSSSTCDTECICDPNATFKNTRSVSPSLLPSGLPSHSPSLSPSAVHTDLSSMPPSDSPTDSPSDSPSNLPTDTPSDYPTLSPSQFPSDLPTYTPSDFPTMPTSENPSDSPSVVPSLSPTPVCQSRSGNSLVNILMLDNETLYAEDCLQVSTNITLSQEFNGRLILKDKHALIWNSTELCGSQENNATYYTTLQRDGNWITWEKNCLMSLLADQKKDVCVAWKSGKNDETTNDDHFVKLVGGTVQIIKGVPPNGTMVHWDSSDTDGSVNPEILNNDNC